MKNINIVESKKTLLKLFPRNKNVWIDIYKKFNAFDINVTPRNEKHINECLNILIHVHVQSNLLEGSPYIGDQSHQTVSRPFIKDAT